MSKTYFHNDKIYNENKSKKKQSTQIHIIKPKNIVDINILLNRVKIEERKEIKQKIIFFSSITFAIALFGMFIIIN